MTRSKDRSCEWRHARFNLGPDSAGTTCRLGGLHDGYWRAFQMNWRGGSRVLFFPVCSCKASYLRKQGECHFKGWDSRFSKEEYSSLMSGFMRSWKS